MNYLKIIRNKKKPKTASFFVCSVVALAGNVATWGSCPHFQSMQSVTSVSSGSVFCVKMV